MNRVIQELTKWQRLSGYRYWSISAGPNSPITIKMQDGECKIQKPLTVEEIGLSSLDTLTITVWEMARDIARLRAQTPKRLPV